MAFQIKSENLYGEKPYYIDEKVLTRKNFYREPIYYFEEVPEQWVLVAMILFLLFL